MKGGVKVNRKVDVASKIVVRDLKNMLSDLMSTVNISHVLVDKQIKRAEEIGDESLIEALSYTMASLANIRRMGEEIFKYFRLININYNIDSSNNRAISNINSSFTNGINKLEAYNKSILREIKELKNVLKMYYNNTAGTSNINELIELVKRNVNHIAYGEYLKSDKHREKLKKTGKESLRFNHLVDNEELVELYKKHGYKLDKEILQHFKAKGANMTYNGLRKRLIDIGIWKGKQK